MAYVGTHAFRTRSTAYHGGDPGWVRSANSRVVSRPSYGRPDLGAFGITEVATITQLAATLAQTGMALRDAQFAKKAQQQQANIAQEQAAAAQKTADAVAAAQIAQIQAQTQAIQEAPTKQVAAATKSRTALYLILGGIAVVSAAVVIMRKRK